MNEKRIAVVKHAWNFLDDQGAKRVSLDKLLKLYNSDAHPRVRTREKRSETVYNDFQDCI